MIWKDIRVIEYGNKTFDRANKSYDKLTHETTEDTKFLGLKVTEKGKTHCIMYWITKIKLYKNVTGVFSFVTSKICKKQISKSVPDVFKLIYSQFAKFHLNSEQIITIFGSYGMLIHHPVIK